MKKVRQYILNIINSIWRIIKSSLGRLLIRCGVIDKFVLVKMDGGICSQMHFYMIGQIFKEKGYLVKYDLSWFVNDGFDLTGKFCRNFDLLNAFPYLEFQKVSRLELFFYRAYMHNNDYFDNINAYNYAELCPPVYLTGYYRDPEGLYCNMRSVFSINNSVFDKRNMELLGDIKHHKSPVAIHVRRGDLSVFNSSYGAPVNSSYFNHSIAYIESKVGKCFYYIFSDEPEWVKNNLIKELSITNNYMVVAINGSDKGYYDLFLIAICNHQITSKGSLGKYGALICNNSDNIVTVYDDEFERETWEGQYSNIIFIK